MLYCIVCNKVKKINCNFHHAHSSFVLAFLYKCRVVVAEVRALVLGVFCTAPVAPKLIVRPRGRWRHMHAVTKQVTVTWNPLRLRLIMILILRYFFKVISDIYSKYFFLIWGKFIVLQLKIPMLQKVFIYIGKHEDYLVLYILNVNYFLGNFSRCSSIILYNR